MKTLNQSNANQPVILINVHQNLMKGFVDVWNVCVYYLEQEHGKVVECGGVP